MFNSNFICSVVPFTKNGEQVTDKNGKGNVMLKVQSGTVPNRTVLPGTIAERSNIEVGNVYLMSCKELEVDPTYGRRFQYEVIQKMDALDAAIALGKAPFGPAKVFDVSEVNSVEETEVTEEKKETVM